MCMSLLNEGARLGHAGGAVDLSYCPLSLRKFYSGPHTLGGGDLLTELG